MSKYFTDVDLDILATSDAYANYIVMHCDGDHRLICNGDTLTVAMEDGYLFEDFIASIENTLECGEAYALLKAAA